MTHTDEQIGRLVEGHLEQIGVLENTVIVLLADNGASGEGGRNGTLSENRYFLGLEDSLDDALERPRRHRRPVHPQPVPGGLGPSGKHSSSAITRRFTHGGGVRAPFILGAPHHPSERRDGEPGGVRHQFHHVIDVVPTLLDLVGGEPRRRRTGASINSRCTVRRSNGIQPAGAGSARSPAPGAVLRDGGEPRGPTPTAGRRWSRIVPGRPFDDDRWELYRWGHRRLSESRDLAGDEPERLAALIRLLGTRRQETPVYGVFPLDDRMGERIAALDPGRRTGCATGCGPGRACSTTSSARASRSAASTVTAHPRRLRGAAAKASSSPTAAARSGSRCS